MAGFIDNSNLLKRRPAKAGKGSHDIKFLGDFLTLIVVDFRRK